MWYILSFLATYSVPELPNNDAIESNYSVPRGSDKVIALYDYESQGDQVRV